MFKLVTEKTNEAILPKISNPKIPHRIFCFSTFLFFQLVVNILKAITILFININTNVNELIIIVQLFLNKKLKIHVVDTTNDATKVIRDTFFKFCNFSTSVLIFLLFFSHFFLIVLMFCL